MTQREVTVGDARKLLEELRTYTEYGLSVLAPGLARIVVEQAKQIDDAMALLADVWHLVAKGQPPPVSDRKTWLALVGEHPERARELETMRTSLIQELERMTADRDQWMREHRATGERLALANLHAASAEMERDRVRAIEAGRTEPPRNEEIDEHGVTGGRWRCVVLDAPRMNLDMMSSVAAKIHIKTLNACGFTRSLWWAIDAKGGLCARSDVGGAR